MSVAVLAATSAEVDDSGIGPGLLGFLVLLGLCVALFVLYRSMRTQLKRIDFDPEGQTDAERMRPDGDGLFGDHERIDGPEPADGADRPDGGTAR